MLYRASFLMKKVLAGINKKLCRTRSLFLLDWLFKVWYHKCESRGKNCNNTRLVEHGGCSIWYNEMQVSCLVSLFFLLFLKHRWDKVVKNGSSKICGRQPLKNLKRYGLLRQRLLLYFDAN